MNQDFIHPFVNSMLSVMGMMAQVEMVPGDILEKNDEISRGDVTGIIDINSDLVHGSMAISFESKLALNMMIKMLGDGPDVIDDEVTDLIGEITNMVTGGAKNELEDQGFDFGMATPAIYVGAQHEVNHAIEAQTYIVAFDSDDGKAYLELCFDNLI